MLRYINFKKKKSLIWWAIFRNIVNEIPHSYIIKIGVQLPTENYYQYIYKVLTFKHKH